MNRIVYYEELFTKRREKLIEYCSQLQRAGKNFIYILPSREAIRDVRYALLDKNKGIINSHIITFDELEEIIVEPHISNDRVIYEEFEKLLITNICKEVSEDLNYYKKICSKNGFIEEVRAFIKALKRQNISEETLLNTVNEEKNEILKIKLKDIHIIYEAYNGRLKKNKIYDINDISLKAVEFVKESTVFEEFDAIIIDGFINIDKVNMELINEIINNKEIDIYVNCSFRNNMIGSFIKEEIVDKLQEMNFSKVENYLEKKEAVEGFNRGEEVLYNTLNEEYESEKYVKEISRLLYSGEKLNIDDNSINQLENIKINKYPCIEAEVRETARGIKKKLMSGEEAGEIAVFVNKSNLYSSHIVKIFKEFKIPAEIIHKTPLSDSLEVREIIKSFEELHNEDENIKTTGEWLEILDNMFSGYYEKIKPAFLNGLKADLSFEDKVLLKGFKGLKRLQKNLKHNFEMCSMLQEQMDSNTFAGYLKDYALNTTLTIENMSRDGVRILNTDLAKGVFYKHVYILGLNEGEVPRVIKNAGLFTDMEVTKLYNHGINYRNYLWELSREKIRYNLTLAAAKESVTLSYRSASEGGGFAIASSFVDEIKFLTGLKEEKSLTMRERFNIDINEVMSELELKTTALKDIFEEYYKGFTVMDKEQKISIVEEFEKDIKDYFAKCLVEYHREKEVDFNNFEGWIGKQGAEDTGEYFRPSAVGTYFRCPYQYLMQQIFNIEDMEVEDNEFTPLEIGTFYHEVLKRYYENTQIEDLYTVNNKGKVDLIFNEDKFNEIFDEEKDNLRELNLDEKDRELIIEPFKNTLHSFLQLDVKRMKKYLKDTGNILVPYLIEERIKDKEAFGIPVSCMVDRVDLEFEKVDAQWKATGKYMIYDYKKNKIADVGDLIGRYNCQIVIYYYMVEHILKTRFEKLLKGRELDCMGLIYLSIEKQNKSSLVKDGLYRTEYKKCTDFGRKNFDVNKEMFNRLVEYVKGLVIQAAEDIKEGKFNYRYNCTSFNGPIYNRSNCTFKNVCRYNKNKVLIRNAAIREEI